MTASKTLTHKPVVEMTTEQEIALLRSPAYRGLSLTHIRRLEELELTQRNEILHHILPTYQIHPDRTVLIAGPDTTDDLRNNS